MDQLYLIEVLVDKIKFASSGRPEVPQKNDFTIFVTFGDMANMEIEPGGIRKDYNEKIDPFNRDLTIDSGKSYLFPIKPENLLKAMDKSPLDLSLVMQQDQSLIGKVTIPWANAFTDMVDRSRFNPDNLQPANLKGKYAISGDGGQNVGEMELFVKLTGLGPNIQTQFQVVQRTAILKEVPPKKFLFKGSKAETTFQAQKYGEDGGSSEMLPVSPLYNPSNPKWQPTVSLSPEEMTAEKINEILCKNRDCPGVQKFKEFGLGPAATGKGLGTVYGPTDIPISYGMSHTYGNLENYGPYGIYSRPKTLEEPFIPKEPISCNTTSGCEECRCGQASETSSKNSVCQCGGPPPISGAATNEDVTCGNTQDKGCCCSQPLRLSGGSPGDDENKVPEPMVMCKDLMQSFDKVLNEYKKALGPCGQVICPFAPNIISESCKKACQKAECTGSSLAPTNASAHPINDGLVSACGTSGCPYSRKPESSTDKAFQQKQIKSACGSPMCPFSKQKVGTATDAEIVEMSLIDEPSVARSCGSPKCPFPLNSSLPPLEPIHWDCPDPLPKGPCRNPQCPLKPPELRYNLIPKGPCGSSKCPYATPANCGDPSCPFGPPQPCPYAQPQSCPPPPCPPSPSCVSGCGGPCGMPPCPPPPCYPPPCPPPSCYPPPCPPPSCSPPPCCCVCGNPGCPSTPPTCGDPYCPLNPAPLPCPGRRPPPCVPPPCGPPPPPCGGPTCPFAPPSPSPCGNPTCPFAPPGSPCGDPDCPFASPPPAAGSPCGNASCPYASSPGSPCGDANCPFASPPAASDTCGNPECPFATKKPSPCYIPPPPGGSNVCANPECPYATPKSIPPKDSLCSNPSCPYAPRKSSLVPAKDSLCSNPTCPFANPCKMQIGGTKVSVEYGTRKDTLLQEVAANDGETEYTSGDRDPNADMEPCSPRTCLAGDGNLECPMCRGDGPSGNYPNEDAFGAEEKAVSKSAPAIPSKPHKGLKRSSASDKAISKTKGAKNGKKQKSKFVYKLGDLYPGVHIGHRECIIPGRNVPAKMGWLWNVHVPCVGLKPRLGWRPGAVGRTIAKRIMAHRKAKGLKLLESLTPKASKKKFKSKYSAYESDSDATVAPKPTLLVKKREGCYYITMNPLKDPKTIEDNENPYMDCTPLQFKITKKETKEDELKTCFCGDEEEEKSSDSELDIEFTPPAGIIRPERLKRKKNVVHTDTQYNPEDFATKDKGKGKGKGKDKGKKGAKGGKGKKGKK